MDLDEIVKVAAEKKAKKDAKLAPKDPGENLQPVEAAPTAQEEAAKSEHTLESLFKPSEPNG